MPTIPSSIRTSARAALVLLLAAASLGAQTADSLPRPEPLFTGRDALVLGGFAIASAALSAYDDDVVGELRGSSTRENERFTDFVKDARRINERSLFLAGVAAYGMGRLTGAERLSDVAFHATEAIVVSSAAATVVRGVLGRSRPFITDGRDQYDFHPGRGFGDLAYRAWPSIHASAGLSAAAVISHEIARDHPRAARVLTPVLYGAAAIPGLARMYDEKHWASDILMGMGLGYWTGRKVVRYHHSREATRTDRWFIGAHGAMPVVTVRF